MSEELDLIRRQKEHPALLRLWQSLLRLRSVVTVLQTGAHPDDETTSMLAALRLRDGVRIVYACSTRGEGGQNAIGPEAGADLAALRTREMEVAAREIDLAVHWLSRSADDPVTDFGFSKDADETFARWKEERVVERLVRVIRREHPDIVLPTFLDVPGQHGHHRAMARATERAVTLAADPHAFPEHQREGLGPWQVAKRYLPAWSGAGQSYDDDLPPPNASVVVDTGVWDAAAGATYAQIAEWSRAGHVTQGMGRMVDAGPASRPLHLAWAANGRIGSEAGILDGLPTCLAELADTAEPAREALTEADRAIARTIESWPDMHRVGRAAAEALSRVRLAAAAVADNAARHRLAIKERELARVMFEAAGFAVRATASPEVAVLGGTVTVTARIFDGGRLVDARPDVAVVVPAGWAVTQDTADRTAHTFVVGVPEDATASDGYPPGFNPAGGNGLVHVAVRFAVDSVEAVHAVELDEPLQLVPAVSVTVSPPGSIANLALPGGGAFSARIKVASHGGQNSVLLSPRLPAGWLAEPPQVHLDISGAGEEAVAMRFIAPEGARSGRAQIRFAIDGQDAYTVRRMNYPHTGTVIRTVAAEARFGLVDATLPVSARIGYVGGGIDHVGDWLAQLGLDVTDLDAGALGQSDLSNLDTIVVGVFALRTRPDLAAAMPRLHDWIRAGGHLLTLYHKPWDGWDPERTPPAFLRIGQPSLRWRVTDENAPVSVLVPDHPLLSWPNQISPEDWAGWHKERGLYFAAEWDPAYVPLLAISDRGEEPLRGGLLSAEIGRGRHTHTSLVLHHQMNKLVPGAFRLMANLTAPAHRP